MLGARVLDTWGTKRVGGGLCRIICCICLCVCEGILFWRCCDALSPRNFYFLFFFALLLLWLLSWSGERGPRKKRSRRVPRHRSPPTRRSGVSSCPRAIPARTYKVHVSVMTRRCACVCGVGWGRKGGVRCALALFAGHFFYFSTQSSESDRDTRCKRTLFKPGRERRRAGSGRDTRAHLCQRLPPAEHHVLIQSVEQGLFGVLSGSIGPDRSRLSLSAQPNRSGGALWVSTIAILALAPTSTTARRSHRRLDLGRLCGGSGGCWTIAVVCHARRFHFSARSTTPSSSRGRVSQYTEESSAAAIQTSSNWRPFFFLYEYLYFLPFYFLPSRSRRPQSG